MLFSSLNSLSLSPFYCYLSYVLSCLSLSLLLYAIIVRVPLTLYPLLFLSCTLFVITFSLSSVLSSLFSSSTLTFYAIMVWLLPYALSLFFFFFYVLSLLLLPSCSFSLCTCLVVTLLVFPSLHCPCCCC